jgi:hypothetical protein
MIMRSSNYFKSSIKDSFIKYQFAYGLLPFYFEIFNFYQILNLEEKKHEGF